MLMMTGGAADTLGLGRLAGLDHERVMRSRKANAELLGVVETIGPIKTAPNGRRHPGFDTVLLGTKGPVMKSNRAGGRNCGFEFLVGLHFAAIIGPRHRHRVPGRPACPPEAGHRPIVAGGSQTPVALVPKGHETLVAGVADLAGVVQGEERPGSEGAGAAHACTCRR
jgi:hypothetical protein